MIRRLLSFVFGLSSCALDGLGRSRPRAQGRRLIRPYRVLIRAWHQRQAGDPGSAGSPPKSGRHRPARTCDQSDSIISTHTIPPNHLVDRHAAARLRGEAVPALQVPRASRPRIAGRMPSPRAAQPLGQLFTRRLRSWPAPTGRLRSSPPPFGLVLLLDTAGRAAAAGRRWQSKSTYQPPRPGGSRS